MRPTGFRPPPSFRRKPESRGGEAQEAKTVVGGKEVPDWIPAFAGMTSSPAITVIKGRAGGTSVSCRKLWWP